MSNEDSQELKKQQFLLENMISTPELFALCSGIVRPDFFEPELRKVVKFSLEYYDKYNNIPTIDTVNAETGMDLAQRTKITSDQFDYCTDQIEQFCRERAVFNEVVNYPKLAQTGDYGQLLERMTNAVHLSLPKDLGVDVFENVQERIDDEETTQAYSTGWSNVDNVIGGLRKTEFLLLSANSGGGKSVGLSNLALALVAQRLNVLYISLELSERLICDRFQTMITKWDRETQKERSAETVHQVEGLKTQYGATIYVKYMPADETCSNDIKAYLKQFEVQHGFLPDALIVDYLDILGTNEQQIFSNEYQKDKKTSTQLRTIGNNPHWPMIMASASQQNRGAVDEMDPNQSHIAGGLSKVNICDVYISIIMTDSMRLEGLAYFKFLKIRSADGVGSKVQMNWDPKAIAFTSTNLAAQREPTDTSMKYRDPFQPNDLDIDDSMMKLIDD